MADYARQVAEAVVRVERGQEQPGDREILKEAMMRFAPSSSVYRRIVSATGQGRFQQPDDLYRQTPENVDSGLLDFGWPTLDFMMGDNGSNTGNNTPSGLPQVEVQNSAQASDLQGEAPIGSNTQVQPGDDLALGLPYPAGEVLTSAGSPLGPPGMGYSNTQNGYDWVGESAIDTGPPGYAVSDIPLGSRREVWENPEVMMNILQESLGGGDMTAAMMMPYMSSARALGSMGLLGRGTGGMGLDAGPKTSTEAMMVVEDFMKMMQQPGTQFLDPDALVTEIATRANNTDMSGLTDSYGNPLGPDAIADITNEAVMSTAPFMTPEAEAFLSSRLQKAKLEYMTAVARGEIDISYPAYLQSIGIDQWLGA